MSPLVIGKSGGVRRTLIALVAAGLSVAATAACFDVSSCAIDLRWPMEQKVVAGPITHVVTIRVIPAQSLDAETYIVVRAWADGRVEADYAVPDGESLFAQARTLAGEHLTAEQLSARFKVRTVHLNDAANLRRVFSRFTKLRMRPHLSAGLYLDATRYDVAEATFMNRFSVSITESSEEPRNDVVEWAKRVVKECQTRALRASR
jgi:hypothetical protein